MVLLTSGGVTSIFMFPENEKLMRAYAVLMASKYAQLDFTEETGWDTVLNLLYTPGRNNKPVNY